MAEFNTTASTPPTCPDWCTEGKCKGEHHAYVGDYVPATAGLPQESRYGGIWFPSIGVSLGWDTIDHLQPCVSLHIDGEDMDAQGDLHLHEARVLLAHLTSAVATLEAASRRYPR